MKLRLMAPFRCHFSLDTGLLAAPTEGYLNFMERVKANFGRRSFPYLDPDAVVCLHERDQVAWNKIRYTSIDEDSTLFTAEVLRLRFLAQEIGTLEGEVSALAKAAVLATGANARLVGEVAAGVRLSPETLEVRVYDDTIAIIQVEADVSRNLMGDDNADKSALYRCLEQYSVAYVDALLQRLYRDALFPLFDSISRDCDSAATYIRPTRLRGWRARCAAWRDRHIWTLIEARFGTRSDGCEPPGAFRRWLRTVMGGLAARNRLAGKSFVQPLPPGEMPQPVRPLWVTRSLLCQIGDHAEGTRDAVQGWLASVADVDEVTDELKGFFGADGTAARGYSMRWLNYAFSEPFQSANGGRNFQEAWEAMLLAQYYWAAVESVEQDLSDVIAQSHRAGRRGRGLNARLEDLMARTRFLEISYGTIRKYLTRRKLAFFSEIMDIWGFEEQKQTVKAVLAACEKRLERVYREAAARSGFYTELILFGIGSVAVFDFVLNVAMVARTLSVDATLGFRDEGWAPVLKEVAERSLDNLLILVLSGGVLVLLWFVHHLRQRSM